MIPTIAVLLTCHNRKDKTIQCLIKLFAQQGLDVEYKIEVFMVDDGSTDGTTEAVNNQFPKVNVIQGNGNLYWNRGMHLAWQTASKTKDFDYYLWLNDDTFLFEEAILSLLIKTDKNSIICGSTKSINSKAITYGGYNNNNKIIYPNGKIQPCKFCNGNIVLISRDVYEIVGMLDSIFHHAVGDFDYTLRANKLGVKIYVGPNFVGTCESHDSIPKWRDSSVSIFKRLKLLYSTSSGCYPSEFFVFEKRHNGLFMAVVHYFSTHLRAIFPRLWKVH